MSEMPLQIFDFCRDFDTSVVSRFISAYERGETPNPCVDCNRFMKFDKLISAADLLGADAVVSGHYVRGGKLGDLSEKIKQKGSVAVCEAIGVGAPTLHDIVSELEKPGRDVRDALPPPQLRERVMTMEELTPGMLLTGTVRNVIDFGAFVDIGVHQDGLVHLSQICDKFIKHPSEVLSVGDLVNVKILSVDTKKNRISLTMKEIEQK